MKRCPQCNRAETDEALKFCRNDGATLVNESAGYADEAGTAQLGTSPDASEVHTSILPHTFTSPEINRPTAPTTVLPPPSAATTGALAKPNRRKIGIGLVVIATAAIAITTAVVVNSYLSPKSAKTIESIAVMPFVNESGDADVEYLSDGMTETLINSLSQIPNLSVKARSSVFRYKGKEFDPKKIAAELNVQAILTGRIVQRGEQMTLNLELIDAQTENILWGNKYERKSSDLVSLQREIARDVSSKLKSKLSGADVARVEKTYTTNPEALQLYLQGQFYRYKGGRNNVLRATDYFNKAIEKDPNYALAYAGLALNYSSYDFYNLVPDWKKASAAAKRALELDDSLAEAHLAAGNFRRAIELRPDYADAHVGLCIDLTMTKHFDEGISECSKARELDPSSVIVTMRLGAAYFFARRPDEAIEIFTRAHEMDPTL